MTDRKVVGHRRSNSDNTVHRQAQDIQSALTFNGHFGSITLSEVIFQQRLHFGLLFSYRNDTRNVLISGFEFLAASLGGTLQIGDEIVACGGINLDGLGKDETAQIIKNAPFPLTLLLRRRVMVPLKRRISSPNLQFYDPNSNSSSAGNRLRLQYLPMIDNDFTINPTIASSSEPQTRVNILADSVADITMLTADIYQASLQLDTHNHMRQQASVMTVGAVERLPVLIEQVDKLFFDFQATLERLEAIEKGTSTG